MAELLEDTSRQYIFANCKDGSKLWLA